MRKSDRECTSSEFFQKVLNKADELYLALNDEDFPYVIPINFVYADNALYFHCAREGKKLDLLNKDSRVAFSTATDIRIDQQKSTTYYSSVCGTGHARLVLDAEEKSEALHRLGQRFAALCPHPLPPAALQNVAVVRITIVSMTGKHNDPTE